MTRLWRRQSPGGPTAARLVAATMAVFFTHGLLFASWTAHIPEIKAQLGLSDGALGLALLGAPVGSVSAMLVAAWLLRRLGSRRMVQISLLGYCAAGPLIGLAGSLPALFAALYAWGAFQGALDVSMNTQAVAVERARDRPLMSGLHGCWSIGALAGAGIGTAGVALGESLSLQLVLLATPALAVSGLLTMAMIHDTRPAAEQPGGSRPADRLARSVLVLGAIAFACMLCEGASADWASVYLRGSLHASAAVAGLAYTAFSATMVTVRLCGNQLLARFGVQRVLPVLAGIASAGFIAGLAGNATLTAIAGFGCLGIGLALVVPTVFSAAGRLPGLSPGLAITTVSACGWIGFVCGPPLIGGLASATSIPVALCLLPVLTLSIVIATARAPALREDLLAGRNLTSSKIDKLNLES
jgi:MFS family permease